MEKEAMKNFKNKLLGFWYYIKFYYIHPNKPYMDKFDYKPISIAK